MAGQLSKIIGKKSKEARDVLGYVGPQFVVDRNNIAVLVRALVGGDAASAGAGASAGTTAAAAAAAPPAVTAAPPAAPAVTDTA